MVLLTTTVICLALPCNGQIPAADSLVIQQITVGFYAWYAEISHQRVDRDFNPNFIEDGNGMTTLDFSKYRKALSDHHFSRDFIEERVRNFKPCLDNLRSIPYSTFITFEGPDQFEQIQCDFSNTHEWSGGMEPVDGADLISVSSGGRRKAVAKLRFYDLRSGEKMPLDWYHSEMTLTKTGRRWEIAGFRLARGGNRD